MYTRKERLQNRIAGSVFTLPVCVVLVVLVWWLPLGRYHIDYAIGLLLTMLIAYVLLETNNRFQLIRTKTRMVACTWLVSAAAIASLHVWNFGIIAALSLAIAHFFLFSTFERREPISQTFHTGFFLGISAVLVPWLIYLWPFFLWHQMLFLRSMSLRCFFASLLGLLFPIMIVVSPCVITNDFSHPIRWYSELISFVPIDFSSTLRFSLQQVVSWVFPFLLVFIGSLHFLFTSYNDKISVRMMFYILLINGLALQVFSILQPSHAMVLFPSVLICGSPLIAHYFTLTHGIFSNLFFLFTLLCYIAIGYLTLGHPTLPFNTLLNL